MASVRLLADRIVHVIDFRYHLVSIVAIFLAAFIAYYFTNWKLLSFLWKVG